VLDPGDLLCPVDDSELFKPAQSEFGPLAVMIVDFLAERRWITAVVADSLEDPSLVRDLRELVNEALSAYGRSTHKANLLGRTEALVGALPVAERAPHLEETKPETATSEPPNLPRPQSFPP
jgi:hypothetical protein